MKSIRATERSGVHHCPKPVRVQGQEQLCWTQYREAGAPEQSQTAQKHTVQRIRHRTHWQTVLGEKLDFELVVELGAGSRNLCPVAWVQWELKELPYSLETSRRYKEHLTPLPFPNFSCLQEPSFGKSHSCPKRQQYMQMLYSLKCHMLMLTSSRHEKRLLWKHMQYCLEHKATIYIKNLKKNNLGPTN